MSNNVLYIDISKEKYLLEQEEVINRKGSCYLLFSYPNFSSLLLTGYFFIRREFYVLRNHLASSYASGLGLINFSFINTINNTNIDVT